MKFKNAYNGGLLRDGMIVNVTKNTCPGHENNTGNFKVGSSGLRLTEMGNQSMLRCFLSINDDCDCLSEIELDGPWQETSPKAPVETVQTNWNQFYGQPPSIVDRIAYDQRTIEGYKRAMINNARQSGQCMYVGDRESFMAYKPKKGFIMGIVKKIKDLAIDANSAALRRNDFEDEDGKMTEQAIEYVDDLNRKEKWAAVRTQVATDVLAVEAWEKK